jgi:hypothetical protein
MGCGVYVLAAFAAGLAAFTAGFAVVFLAAGFAACFFAVAFFAFFMGRTLYQTRETHIALDNMEGPACRIA